MSTDIQLQATEGKTSIEGFFKMQQFARECSELY